MAIRKFKADQLFTGYEIKQENAVLVTDTAGVVKDIIDVKDAGDDIEVLTGLLTPGFINAHCHLELSHLKGVIPTGTGLVNFVQQVMTRRAATEEEKLAAIEKAEQELYSSGTVAVGDICNTADPIAVKQKSKLQFRNFIEVSGFVDSAAGKRFSDAQALASQFSIFNFQFSISPHAPYSVSKTLFSLLNGATAGQLITIHNQETAAEDQLYKSKEGGFLELYKNFNIDISGFQPTGKSSLQSWFPYFTNNQSIILVHNSFIGKDDLEFISGRPLVVGRQDFFCV
jgi:cytosine/adenosine deaminase-related metal-dependent hydrolase